MDFQHIEPTFGKLDHRSLSFSSGLNIIEAPNESGKSTLLAFLRVMLYGFPPAIIGIKPESQLFRTLTQMQDEVHRFAISFHRDKRSKRQTASELDTIAGIGPATKQTLLKQFKSVKRVKEATLPELQALLGTARGEKIYHNLHTNG